MLRLGHRLVLCLLPTLTSGRPVNSSVVYTSAGGTAVPIASCDAFDSFNDVPDFVNHPRLEHQ